MDRRRLLAAVGALVGLAGCRDAQPPGGKTTESERTPATAGTTVPLARHGRPSDICSESIQADPEIYAITDPAFGEDWQGLDVDDRYTDAGAGTDSEGIADEATVIGLDVDGVARAYPVDVLWWHEIVNDTVAGRPLLVTHCPICRTGMVAERRVDGEEATFAVSGLLWEPPDLYGEAALDRGTAFAADRRGTTAETYGGGNLVMYDFPTESYWSQVLARAICGPQRGTTLTITPSTLTTWRRWREDNPETEVLLPPPHSTTTERSESAPTDTSGTPIQETTDDDPT